MAPNRFAYYQRLSAKDKATYRKSDGIGAILIPNVAALAPLVAQLEEALVAAKRAGVATAVQRLTDALLEQLEAPPLKVHVRLVRPSDEGGELHGLYTFAANGKPPKLEVWMKTAANARIVRFRTFLRTLLHEIAHHLDVTIFELEDSFHTEGFFRRESSLVRQLAPKPKTKPRVATVTIARPRATAKQLTLF